MQTKSNIKNSVSLTESELRALVRKSIIEATETIQGFEDSECLAPPKVTMVGYKLVRLYPNPHKLKEMGKSKEEIQRIIGARTNKVYPPYFVNNGWELGKWYTSGLQDITVEIDDQSGQITKMSASGRNPKGSKMNLSPNVGLHALEIPLAYDNASKANGLHMPPDLVWAEVEINFEPYDEKEYKRKMGTIKSKEMYPTLQQMSKDKKPFYRGGFVKGFNGKIGQNVAGAKGCKQVTVYLSSDFKFNRLLTQDEVKSICSKNGVKAIDHELALDLNHYFPNNTWQGSSH